MTNQNDPVPTVPPRFLGFQHPSGEIHVVDDTQQNFVACPGQDNTNCATGNSVLSADVSNHKGGLENIVSTFTQLTISVGPYFDDLTFARSGCSS
jgi:hypothetical protein